jgi:aminopeptidase YwaD
MLFQPIAGSREPELNTITGGALKHTQHLAIQIGNRLIGSAGNLAAAAYIESVFEAAGLAVEAQDIPCPDWIAEHTFLGMGPEALEVCANTFSPACDITAKTMAVGTPAELELAQIASKILIFYGDMAQHELAARKAIYIPDRDRRTLEILDERRPAGIITVNPTLHERWRLVEDFDLDIPSVTVSARSGLRLLQNPGGVVHMQIAARRSPGRTSNVIGRLPGEILGRIVLCAHYDTKEDTPGAYDNAAGVGVLLALAELLSGSKHRHTIECVAFTGEEGYGLGDMEYARRMGNGFDQVTAAINFDGVGPFTGTTTVASFVASPELDQFLDKAILSYPAVARVEPWPASDHYIFYSHGTPSIAFGSTGIRDLYHTASDTFEWISGEKLGEVLGLAQALVEELDIKDLSWSRPRTTTPSPRLAGEGG